MPTRCCWPPDNWRGIASSRPDRPTSAIICAARSSRAARGTPCTCKGKATLSSTLQMRQQGEVLKHHAHLVAANVGHLGGAGGKQVAAVEQDLAGGGFDQA